MLTSQTMPRALARAISLALGVAALPASAVDYTWVGWYSDWDIASNWNTVGVPQDGDSATIYDGGIVTYNTASPLYLTSVTVDGASELHVTGSSLHADTLIAGATVWNEGEIHLSGGSLSGASLQIGRDAGSNGNFIWDGGNLDVERISVGTGGSGTFVYNTNNGNGGWTLAEHQSVVIGEQAGSTGVFEQRQGIINESSASQIVIGGAGNGTYLQFNSNHNALETVIGSQAGSVGTYEMYGYSNHSSGLTVVGDAGTGHYLNHGMYHTTDELIIGRSAGGVGDYQLNGYGLNASRLVLGDQAGSQGTFTWTGGDLDARRIVVGRDGAGTFVMDNGGGTLSLVGDFDSPTRELIIGEQAGSEGVFEQRSGYVNHDQTLIVGQAGRGVYRNIGGGLQADIILLGRYAGSEGLFELAGDGAWLNTGATLIGHEGIGRFVHTTGGHDTGTIEIGTWDATGHYAFNGGWLGAQSLRINKGDFTWTGGELYVTDMRVGNSGPYGSSGSFIQDTGPGSALSLASYQTIVIGNDGGEGVYEQRSGDVDARDSQIIIGGNGRGTYRHLDGLHQATETVIGRRPLGGWSPSEGTYELIGHSATHIAQRTVVGDTGFGRFIQAAGINDTQELIVGRGAQGEYSLNGGDVYAQSIVLGDAGTSDGRFTWAGGNLYFGHLRIGRAGSGTFIQDIGESNELSLAPHQALVIAEQAGSHGYFEQRSGNVDSRYSPIVIGESGIGGYDQMAGLHQATETVLGRLSGSQGYYALFGTATHISQRTVVGDAGYGGYHQASGYHDTQELVVAQSAGSYGYYDLYGGDLNTSTTRIASTSGATGAMRIHGADAHWHNASIIYVGAEGSSTMPPGAGLVELRDGAVISATAVIVAQTGTLRGTGTTMADVFNNGDLSPGWDSAHFGHLDIFGNYVQQDEGTLSIQIGAGLNQDMVNIFGDATLGGTLNVTLSNAFDIGLGHSFDILYASMVYGSFDNLLFPIFNGMTFDIAYDLNTVRLTVVNAVPVPAAAWLFGSGVVALMGIARRRKAA